MQSLSPLLPRADQVREPASDLDALRLLYRALDIAVPFIDSELDEPELSVFSCTSSCFGVGANAADLEELRIQAEDMASHLLSVLQAEYTGEAGQESMMSVTTMRSTA